MSTTKILHIIPTLRKGGAERLVLNICIELQKRTDIEVCLVTFSQENDYSFLSKKVNHVVIPSYVIPSISKKAAVDIQKLTAFINSFQPNIIHSHLFEAEMVSRWKIYDNIKYFTHCHDNMIQFRALRCTEILNKQRLTQYYEKQLITQKYKATNNQFIAISQHTKSFFEQNLPNSLQANVHLLHNAIDFAQFAIVPQPSNIIRLINVGSFVEKKNQAFLIEVANFLRKQSLNFKITLLGDGPLRETVIEKIASENLQAYFDLPGLVAEVEQYYAQSNIYIHSALYEPLGLVLLEAMAAGLPVICLDGGGNRDLIHHGKNGFFIEQPNAELFAKQIVDLINNKQQQELMASYAREFAKGFDITPYVDSLLRLYNQS